MRPGSWYVALAVMCFGFYVVLQRFNGKVDGVAALVALVLSATFAVKAWNKR